MNPLQPIHLLSQLGVMSSFSIAKKVTEDDIRKYFDSQKKEGKSDEEISNMLREKIMKEIQDAINTHAVPGLRSPEEVAKEMGIDKKLIKDMPGLTRLIMVIANKLMEKHYDKMSLCYFINGLVNILDLSDSDFEKFHEDNVDDKDGDDEDGDDDKFTDA